MDHITKDKALRKYFFVHSNNNCFNYITKSLRILHQIFFSVLMGIYHWMWIWYVIKTFQEGSPCTTPSVASVNVTKQNCFIYITLYVIGCRLHLPRTVLPSYTLHAELLVLLSVSLKLSYQMSLTIF